ncbi:hypothetical protein N0V88_008155 [Collariella sp. IMI 366227]|nr:hypothetical protein N0V88_008155 [Collariella sp. IMI 366227]
MPWRKPFTPIPPPRDALSKRAYEVWISEIMLQQTRVTTVVGYWTSWIKRWPTIEDLARAEMDEPMARDYVTGLLKPGDREGAASILDLKHVGEIGSVPWQFSHFKLIMYVHLFELGDVAILPGADTRQRWASTEDIDMESMGTGMKKCWTFVKDREEEETR